MQSKPKQVDIFRTEGEWEQANERIKKLGNTNIRNYVKYQVIRMAKKFDDCENCVTPAEGEKIRKTFYLDEYCMRTLLLISLKMKKPIASVVDDLIINPLLNERT